jgi:hypothetical protein
MTTADVTQLLNRMRDLPAPVSKWEVETGADATGDDAVWVWAILEDAIWNKLSEDARASLRESIRNAVSGAADKPAPWVYVRFRTVRRFRALGSS